MVMFLLSVISALWYNKALVFQLYQTVNFKWKIQKILD